MKLSYCDRLDRVWSITKNKEDNYVTNHVSLVHIETETELLGPIWSCAIYDEN